ncbi:MAG TPA: 50S ribosomal protein L24 [Solirubrobacteraceae bacterium]|nr:50S ribosomal protein L24 [Solirubrobacteraceae bacterium]
MARAASTQGARRSLKIRSGDKVHVIAGKARGKSGRVLRVDPARERVYVEGLNMVKRHMRPQQVAGARQTVGGVIEQEGPIHISNVMLADPKDEKPTRIGIERENGRRFRVAKRSGTRLD